MPGGAPLPGGESYLKAGRLKTCKMCNHQTIAELDPEFASWFVDPELPKLRPPYSKEKAAFYCQQCASVVEGLTISNIYKRLRVSCPFCSDGISYPERYVGAVLDQMGIGFKRQFCVRYRENGRERKYLYDFFDEERRLVIEAHGAQHFEEKVFDKMGGNSLEETGENDRKKEAYAREVLGCAYIWLDCRKSEPEWIKKEIFRKLSFYPLERVDWEAVGQKTNSSLTLEVVRLHNEGYSCEEISRKVQLHTGTVYVKLRGAKQAGFEVKLFPPRKPAVRPVKKAPKKAAPKPPKTAPRKNPVNPRQVKADAMLIPENLGGEEKLFWLRQRGQPFGTLEKYRSSVTPLPFLCAGCGLVF